MNNSVWIVQANGIEDENEIYFICTTKDIAVAHTLEQLKEDLVDASEWDDNDPDQEDKDDGLVISYDDYMSYRVYEMPLTSD